MICLCIDLKSFYASVECIARGFDPLNTNLVVADESRTEKTICLAVTPSLKSLGVPGRPRLFEVEQIMRDVNEERLRGVPSGEFSGSSHFACELQRNRSLKADFIIAPPHMARYMKISSYIYSIYLKYISPEDIHVYSVDEVFIDITNYIRMYDCTPHDLAMRIIRDVLDETGITATAGIGTNMFLAKIAMDIVAKKMPADKNGVRIAELDEASFRRKLWGHTPLTDFWRFGPGITRRLEKLRIHTLGDLARVSERNENVIYREFGKNAELIIDHAWGWEPCTIAEVRSYRPENHSMSQGQVLPEPYKYDSALLIVKEMADLLSLDLVRKGVSADQLVLSLGYDHSYIPKDYEGKIVLNHYGKKVPAGAHGSLNFGKYTSSAVIFINAAVRLFREIADERLLVRRICIAANHVIPESAVPDTSEIQYSFFDDAEAVRRKRQDEEEKLAREKKIQQTLVSIKSRYGKNAILKGMNFEEGGTAIERNGQVGGHRA
ncbi:MAG: DNA methylase [Oscillospiraceae bacterium]|nr:DNA methylase [Oscillospiraceae bacterium]